EIRNAGQGFFGSLTSEFALLVNHSFKKYGQPNAYIIGDEGGGAFLAGLRYGDGKLYTRVNGVESGPTSIYWQGPSLGADLGATGSRTLFLVYNLDDPANLYRRFPGIDGSAYAVGGWGLTVYRSGNTLIVPIRTGLGLRLGASIAYLKFTERASLNPF
ncbi:MAG: EipA family protein, partial [Rhodomicrobium sp.]